MKTIFNLRNLSTVLLCMLAAASARSQQEQTTITPPAKSAIDSDWERMREGMRRATPMPPANVYRPDTATPSEGMFSYDIRSRQSFHVSSGTPELQPNSPVIEVENPGTVPESADIAGSSAPKAGLAGESVVAKTASNGVTRTDIKPTPPSGILRPYTFPVRTEFRLLVRFKNPGAADSYHYCSASSVSDFHLLTSGGCLYRHSAKGDGFAAEIWAWPAETDVVFPVGAAQFPINYGNWPDFPYGVAKATRQTVYNAWKDTSDANWDIGFITLDRRIGHRVGWMGRELEPIPSSLHLSGYPFDRWIEYPDLIDNEYQYDSFDPGNVSSSTCCRIAMDAITYPGELGGGAWRYTGTDHVLQGVISAVSPNSAHSEITRITSQVNSDLSRRISDDQAEIPPVDRAELIEYVFDNSSKALITDDVFVGDKMRIKVNAYDVGSLPSVGTKAAIYLLGANLAVPPVPPTPTSKNLINKGTLIGTIDLGTLGANKFTVQTHSITVPHDLPLGYYYVGWELQSSTPQYGGDLKVAVLKHLLIANGLTSIVLADVAIEGGKSIVSTVFFSNNVPEAVDVALSSDNPAAHVPTSVHFTKYAYEASFDVKTMPVSSETTATITATYGGISKKVKLTILPASSAQPPPPLQ